MKQAHGAECNVVFQYFFSIKKVQSEKKCAARKQQRRSQDLHEHLKWRNLQRYLTVLLVIATKLSNVDVCGGPS